MKPLVGIIMGSKSDWDTLQSAADTLQRLGVAFETRVVSAHRTPDLLFEYASTARARGLEVIIAGAGGAAHLPGMTAAKTSLPVLGVPVQSKALNGMDSLLSIVQMPAGIPGRHARHRRSRRDQRRSARRSHPRQQVRQTSAPHWTSSAPSRRTACSPNPLPQTAHRRHEDRHHRRGPAWTHAGAGGLSARPALRVPRPERGRARRAGGTHHRRCVRRPQQARRAGARSRRDHFRRRERAGRGRSGRSPRRNRSCRRSRRSARRRTGCTRRPCSGS